jgi:hypothetical protein
MYVCMYVILLGAGSKNRILRELGLGSQEGYFNLTPLGPTPPPGLESNHLPACGISGNDALCCRLSPVHTLVILCLVKHR